MKRMVKTGIMAVAMAGMSSSAFAQLPAPPRYVARRAVDAITVDGVLNEASWALAPRVGKFALIRDTGKPVQFPTEAAIIWDDTNLYVSFASTDREPWGTLKQFDDKLWDEEVVEVFLDPDGDGKQYTEYEVSPDNVLVDLLIPEPRATRTGADNRVWNHEGWKTAVTKSGDHWIVEMALPWRGLAAIGITRAPSAGDTWRVGLYRIKRPGGAAKQERIASLTEARKTAAPDRQKTIDAELATLRANDEYQAWSVTRGDRGFHDPERFGYVTFQP